MRRTVIFVALVSFLLVGCEGMLQTGPKYIGDPSTFKYKVVRTVVEFRPPRDVGSDIFPPDWHIVAQVPSSVSTPHVYRVVYFVNDFEVKYYDLPPALMHYSWPTEVRLRGTAAEWIKQADGNYRLVSFNHNGGYSGYAVDSTSEVRIIRQTDNREMFNSTKILSIDSGP